MERFLTDNKFSNWFITGDFNINIVLNDDSLRGKQHRTQHWSKATRQLFIHVLGALATIKRRDAKHVTSPLVKLNKNELG